MSKNINSTRRHLKYSDVSIFAKHLWTDNAKKSAKLIYKSIKLKKYKIK